MLKFAITVFPAGAAIDMLFNGAKMVLAMQSSLLALADQAAHLLLPL